MKTIQKLILITFLCSVFLLSCDDDPKSKLEPKLYISTFEDVNLSNLGYWNGSDKKGTRKEEIESSGDTINCYYGGFTSGYAYFENKFSQAKNDTTVTYWTGFACSALVIKDTIGRKDQKHLWEYLNITNTGADQSSYWGFAHNDGATINIPSNNMGYFSLKSMRITNHNFTAQVIQNGDSIINAKAFNSADEDWFKVIIKGYKGNNEVKSVEHYLADFRNGRRFIQSSWEMIDLSSFGEVDKLVFYFDSSDKNGDKVITPAYVCIDNLQYEQMKEVYY